MTKQQPLTMKTYLVKIWLKVLFSTLSNTKFPWTQVSILLWSRCTPKLLDHMVTMIMPKILTTKWTKAWTIRVISMTLILTHPILVITATVNSIEDWNLLIHLHFELFIKASNSPLVADNEYSKMSHLILTNKYK